MDIPEKPGRYFKGYLGGWGNIFRSWRHRGEGDPAPWLIIKGKRLGIQLDGGGWEWLRVEPGFLKFGPLILAWKKKKNFILFQGGKVGIARNY